MFVEKIKSLILFLVIVCVCVPVVGAQARLPGSVLAVGVVAERLACVIALARLLLYLREGPRKHRVLKEAADPGRGNAREFHQRAPRRLARVFFQLAFSPFPHRSEAHSFTG